MFRRVFGFRIGLMVVPLWLNLLPSCRPSVLGFLWFLRIGLSGPARSGMDFLVGNSRYSSVAGGGGADGEGFVRFLPGGLGTISTVGVGR